MHFLKEKYESVENGPTNSEQKAVITKIYRERNAFETKWKC